MTICVCSRHWDYDSFKDWLFVYYDGDGFDWYQTDFGDDTPFGYDVQGYRTEKRIRSYHRKLTRGPFFAFVVALVTIAVVLVFLGLEVYTLKAKVLKGAP